MLLLFVWLIGCCFFVNLCDVFEKALSVHFNNLSLPRLHEKLYVRFIGNARPGLVPEYQKSSSNRQGTNHGKGYCYPFFEVPE
ncbi:MAG TPA: hypothetical protein DF409_12880 [Bacteroidales bacterium]|nr:hypothetical protein [Bacteroidales bacterium]